MSGPVREQAAAPGFRFAPDPAARRAAAGLQWVESGVSESCAWGRCQGSAADPYQTIALLGSDSRTACTCPSRQRPCKHVLGLLLRLADADLVERPEPEFARQWRIRLEAERGRPRVRAADPQAAAEAAAKRAAQRRQRVAAGLDELDRWLADQLRNGLAALPRAGYAHFDAIAARMVDAQAPGVAGMLRSMPGELVGERWPERTLHRLGGLHLLVQAHRRLDDLPDELAATVRSRIGYPVAKADVLATPGVPDTWWAVGAVDTVDYQLESRRVWLIGARTGRWAVWLAFAPPGQELDTSVLPGMVLPSDLHFYPGSGWRALVGERQDGPAELLHPPPASASTVTAARARFAEALAADPWAGRMPTVISGVPLIPGKHEDDWRLRDVDGRTCPLIELEGEPWPVLAQSAGRPLSVFGEWSGHGLRPLSVLADDDGRTFSTEICG